MPFTFLPAILWWLVPLGIVAAVVVSWRPSLPAIVAMLACLTLPVSYGVSWTMDVIANGNPVLWVSAFVALATRYPAFGPFALLKPTPLLIPFAFIRARERAFWVGMAVLTALSLPFLPMWFDYARALLNASTGALAYAATSIPIVVLPLIPWAQDRSTARSMIVTATRAS